MNSLDELTPQRWAPIQGFPAYEISTLGEVRRAGKLIKQGWAGRPHCRKYRAVRLYLNGRRFNKVVHRLVWEAFLGLIPEGFQVDHVDDNHSHNQLSNLQLLSHHQNQAKKPRKAA